MIYTSVRASATEGRQVNFMVIVATNPLISAVLCTSSNQLFTRSVAIKCRHSDTENEYRRCCRKTIWSDYAYTTLRAITFISLHSLVRSKPDKLDKWCQHHYTSD